ncbi:V-type ATP synthase subunit D [Chitinivibrio alkaliphilus]|uniref:V-type ATPase, subunit D n=1 Tax=Chitinivibrio alkaliphilus ACht1 TaxID=1313304 RepID=U7D8G5_9BACT|nr:V-type ATP synthase subunit D [Chitinivibrio alkaliphilus]ERP31836.1 V-type ATPase, subunit D [Chitinivibrio alkaliphilus ACht1]
MALKFQFNKTEMQRLEKDLKIRRRALPTLKAKETALRLEVKKAKEELRTARSVYEQHYERMMEFHLLWEEFPEQIFTVRDVSLQFKKIAGVKIPFLTDVDFSISAESFFTTPSWIATGIQILKEAARLDIEIEVARERLVILEYARKKTTQKVNLYEKVQIPAYQGAITSIKRFLEDKENIAKAAQKITKKKLELAGAQ